MNRNRFSPALLLLALAIPVRAQDAGPGVMLQELSSLSDAAVAIVSDKRGMCTEARGSRGRSARGFVEPSQERPGREMGDASTPDGVHLDIAVARAELAGGALDLKLLDAGMPTIMTADGDRPVACLRSVNTP